MNWIGWPLNPGLLGLVYNGQLYFPNMTFYEKTTLDFSPVANSQTADRQGDIAMNPHDPTLIPLPIELCVRGSPVPARPPARKQPPYLVPGLLLDHGLAGSWTSAPFPWSRLLLASWSCILPVLLVQCLDTSSLMPSQAPDANLKPSSCSETVNLVEE